MSSFAAGAGTVTFTATDPGGDVERLGPVRTFTPRLLVATAADWATLAGMRSWSVSVRPIPGGSNVYVDVGGGAGTGALVLDNVAGSPFVAVLTDLSRPDAFPSGQRECRATFLAW